ncbi:hypothetical protein BMS3Abin07_00216 [bacterium BMS3Abin07]|nr:hypothetical protein BMS3Abin07_00216 [bacterium BMS3Abin07]
MNTTEKIVESYFRLCKGCFTMADVKVISRNNRQIDLLALNFKTGDQYHVEVSVTHRENWCPTTTELFPEFEKKYFGVPAKREGQKTDYALGKNYKEQIYQTYKSVGLSPGSIKRVWVCWTVIDDKDLDAQIAQYCRKRKLKKNTIEIISFRDEVIPTLMEKVATANYEDDVLRTLSLLQQFEKQQQKIKNRNMKKT